MARVFGIGIARSDRSRAVFSRLARLRRKLSLSGLVSRGPKAPSRPVQTTPPPAPPTSAEIGTAVERSRDRMLGLQTPWGGWVGELIADTTLESDYILMKHILGESDPGKVERLARYILSRQLPDGGWNIYVDGPSELNATVKAWLALRVAGYAATDPRLVRARNKVLSLGGIAKGNSYLFFLLAMLGQVRWEDIVAPLPELLLLPDWFYLNVNEISSWSRAIIVPLCIIYAKKPVYPLPPEIDVESLWLLGTAPHHQRSLWKAGLKKAKHLILRHAGRPLRNLRRKAISHAEAWMKERMIEGGNGAIFPGILNSLYALLALGTPKDDALLLKTRGELAKLEVPDGDVMRIQPCFSPVWDTAWGVISLVDAGVAKGHPALARAVEWLAAKEVRREGDWKRRNPDGAPGGWYFEFDNDLFPDTDDTCAVLMALAGAADPADPRLQVVQRRGLDWLLSMQSANGGWGAFDKNNDNEFLTWLPYADHNALIDPPTVDLTGRILEALGKVGFTADRPEVKRALEFIRREQGADGSWYGRWGVNYVYGTWAVLRGIEEVGASSAMRAETERGAAWLRSVQREDGGWGETCATYEDDTMKGKGPSTPSQTAWGVMGLLSVAGPEDPSVVRGLRYLLLNQRPDGGWDEQATTGTGFPGVFYLVYSMYRDYFPLMALSMYRARLRTLESRP